MTPTKYVSFVVLADQLHHLPVVLRAAFEHAWIGSFQVGFGPPLLQSSARLKERLQGVVGALDKLEAYLAVCVLDAAERERLAVQHRRILVRRHGPLEAEAVNRASADVLDLMLRLRSPLDAPPDVRASMDAYDVDPAWIPDDAAPDLLSGRFLVHLSDPRNERLLYADAVRSVCDPDTALAVDLRVPAVLRPLWAAWSRHFAKQTGYRVVDLGEPPAHARVLRDGTRS
ncbi:MAG: hypothetical protein RIT81_22390 [Deltaproteobacteria bacterium]